MQYFHLVGKTNIKPNLQISPNMYLVVLLLKSMEYHFQIFHVYSKINHVG